jgi:hypothetical protein
VESEIEIDTGSPAMHAGSKGGSEQDFSGKADEVNMSM